MPVRVFRCVSKNFSSRRRSRTLAGAVCFSPPFSFSLACQRKRKCAAGGGKEKENAAVRIGSLTGRPTTVLVQVQLLVDLTCSSFRCRCCSGYCRTLRGTKKKNDQVFRLDRLWSGRRGSNSLPPPWQGGALPDELRPQNNIEYNRCFLICQYCFWKLFKKFWRIVNACSTVGVEICFGPFRLRSIWCGGGDEQSAALGRHESGEGGKLVQWGRL